MQILSVNNLGINFGYGTLFEEVSFSLNEKESISIVGPNGCGKTTLLKIFAEKIFEVNNYGITIYNGNYDYYVEKRNEINSKKCNRLDYQNR